MLQAHSKQRYSISLEDLKLVKASLFKLNTLSRKELKAGFLKYVEIVKVPPCIMKISAIYGAHTFLHEQNDHDMGFWKLKIDLFSNQSLIGLLIGDILASGYASNEIDLLCKAEILPLFE